MVTYFDRRGHWLDYVSTLGAAAGAAQRLGDRYVLARTMRMLGRANTVLNNYGKAERCYRQALSVHVELNDVEGQGRAHRGLSVLYQRQERYEEALAHGQLARKFFQATENRSGEARALHTLGWCSAALGEFEKALAHCRDAIRLFGELTVPDTQGEASAVDSYAYALHRFARHADAVTQYQRAVDLWSQLGNSYYEANTLTRLGTAYLSCHDPVMAEQSWLRALAILETLNHEDASAVRAELARLRAL